MKKQNGKPSLSKSKKKAWEAFSRYIRLKYSDGSGFAACYTCGARLHWKQLQCGHLLDGRANAILFCEEAVRPQCARCNLFLGGNKEVYIPKFIDECGREKYDELVRLKHTTVKFSISELEEMRERWSRE